MHVCMYVCIFIYTYIYIYTRRAYEAGIRAGTCALERGCAAGGRACSLDDALASPGI